MYEAEDYRYILDHVDSLWKGHYLSEILDLGLCFPSCNDYRYALCRYSSSTLVKVDVIFYEGPCIVNNRIEDLTDDQFKDDYMLALEHLEYLGDLDLHIRGNLETHSIRNHTAIQLSPMTEDFIVRKQPNTDDRTFKIQNNRFSKIREYKETDSRGKYTLDRARSGTKFVGWEYDLDEYPHLELLTTKEYLTRLLEKRRKGRSAVCEPEFDQDGNRLPRRNDCWWTELGNNKCLHPFLIQSVESDSIKGYYCTSSSIIFEGKSPIKTTKGILGVHNAAPVLRTISRSMLIEY